MSTGDTCGKDSLGKEKEMASIPVFFPGESLVQRSLPGHSPERLKELDMIDVT